MIPQTSLSPAVRRDDRRWVRTIQVEGAAALLVMIAVSLWIVLSINAKHAAACRRSAAFAAFVHADTRLAMAREAHESAGAAALDRAAVTRWRQFSVHLLDGC